MSAPVLYLIASVVWLAFAAAALTPVRRLRFSLPVYFFAGWLTSELALFHVAWQALATLAFAAAGALSAPAGVWGLAITFVSWAGLLVSHHRSLGSRQTLIAALEDTLGEDFRTRLPKERAGLVRHEIPLRVALRPFSFGRPGVEVIRNLSYGDAGKRNLLDVVRPTGLTEASGPRPALLQIHGGAWIIGEKEQQGQPLMHHMAERGWVCVAPNYRLGPKARFPDMLTDCKRVLAWMRSEGLAYGIDPNFIAVTGGSAGGHLTSLVALTAGRPELQPGFEDADTSVAAAVPFYGVYDFLEQKQQGSNVVRESFLEDYVMPGSAEAVPEMWKLASPVSQVHADAPPFFAIHGTHDTLAVVEDARFFVESLRSVSRAKVAYAELQGAQHAFDVFHTVRSDYTVHAVSQFLEWCHAEHDAAR